MLHGNNHEMLYEITQSVLKQNSLPKYCLTASALAKYDDKREKTDDINCWTSQDDI
jgi:hypothetical protein